MNDKPRILVVDDESQLTRVLRTGLNAHGYEVRTASDGVEGFRQFSDWHPDLIITDLAMPNMDGLELCRRVRAVSQVPIIILSAKGEEKTKVDALLARVRASLRRANAGPTNGADKTLLETGDFRVDLDSRVVTVHGGEIH